MIASRTQALAARAPGARSRVKPLVQFLIASILAFGAMALAKPQQTIPSAGGGSGTGTVTNITTTSPLSGGTITTSGTIACSTCTVDVAHGTATMGTAAISANTCATDVTVSASGVATTDVIDVTPGTKIVSISGYGATTSEGLNITWYPTSGDVNFTVCNPTANSITPGSAAVLSWAVRR